MKIQFGTPLTPLHVVGTFFFGCAIFGISFYNADLGNVFAESKRTIFRSRGLNLTDDKASIFYCNLPFNDSLCSVLLNKSDNAEHCISDFQLLGSQILPLFSYFSELFLIRQLFSLSGDHRQVIIYTSWIVSIFTFIGMTICIYLDSCYHAYITLVLFWTAIILWFLSAHNMITNIERLPSSSPPNKIFPDRKFKANHKRSRAWQELP